MEKWEKEIPKCTLRAAECRSGIDVDLMECDGKKVEFKLSVAD